MTCHLEIELGAYVLHGLEPEEAEAVSEHLTTCQICRDEERSLAATAGLLALLRPEDLEVFEDVHDFPGENAQAVQPYRQARPDRYAWSGRRRLSPRRAARAAVGGAVLAGAALTAAVVSGVVVGVVAGVGPFEHDSPPSSSAAVVQAVDPATHVHAAVAMSQRESGTRLRLSLAGAYPHGRCSLVARSRDGGTDTAATWVADAHGTAWVSGMTAFRTDQLTEFDVVTGTGRVLVRIPVPHTPASNRS
jgi:hypothetical protein